MIPKNYICIILARKGSKRIKNKNLVKINGTPLIEYTLNSIKKIMPLNNIFISTNDTKIMKVAKKHNINIIKRPAKLCRDNSSSEDGLIHAIKLIQIKKKFENVIFLQPTSPLRKASSEPSGPLCSNPLRPSVGIWAKRLANTSAQFSMASRSFLPRPSRSFLNKRFMPSLAVC